MLHALKKMLATKTLQTIKTGWTYPCRPHEERPGQIASRDNQLSSYHFQYCAHRLARRISPQNAPAHMHGETAELIASWRKVLSFFLTCSAGLEEKKNPSCCTCSTQLSYPTYKNRLTVLKTTQVKNCSFPLLFLHSRIFCADLVIG